MSLIKWYHPVSKQNYQSPILLTPSLLWGKPEPPIFERIKKTSTPSPPYKGVFKYDAIWNSVYRHIILYKIETQFVVLLENY